MKEQELKDLRDLVWSSVGMTILIGVLAFAGNKAMALDDKNSQHEYNVRNCEYVVVRDRLPMTVEQCVRLTEEDNQ